MADRHDVLDEVLERLKIDRYDAVAWSKLYDVLLRRGRAVAYRYLRGDSASAIDVVHDGLARVLEYTDFSKFSRGDDVVRYFSTLVRNLAFTRLRRSAGLPVESFYAFDAGGDPDAFEDELPSAQVADERPTPEETWAAKKSLEALQETLSGKDKLVTALIAEGYSAGEIGARLGVTTNNARVMVHRLRTKLRALLPRS